MINELQPNDFQYVLSIEGKDYILPHSPKGWEGMTLTWSRSKTYYGVLRNFSVPLQFVLDGAYLLRKQFYKRGIEGEATLTIEKLNRSTYQFESMYEGDIDFSTFNDSASFVTVGIMEGGASKILKAYDKTKFDISIEDLPHKITSILPVKLKETAQFLTTMTFPEGGFDETHASIGMSLDVSGSEIPAGSGSSRSSEYIRDSSVPDYATSEEWFYKATTDGEFTISSDSFAFRTKNLNPSLIDTNVKVYLMVAGASVTFNELYEVNVPADGVFHDYAFPIDLSLTLEAGDKLFVEFQSIIGTPHISEMIPSSLKVSGFTESGTSTTLAVSPIDLFKAIVSKMVEASGLTLDVSAYSAFLTSLAPLPIGEGFSRQLLITCGDALRGLAGAKIKTSMDEFFRALNGVYNCGLGIEGTKIVLEQKAYFYAPFLMGNLGTVRSFELEAAKDYFFNQLDIGYPNQDYNDLNGRDEYNSLAHWSSPITRIANKLDLTSPYRADHYGIEFTRRNYEGKTTTDSNSDNSTFFLECVAWNTPLEGGETAALEKPLMDYGTGAAYSSISGVIDSTTAYNAGLSPKKNLLRHGNFIHGVHDKISGQLKFTSADKNAELETVSSVIVKENANINLSDLATPLFLPYTVTVSSLLPANFAGVIDSLRTGYLTFTYNDTQYKGFLEEVSVEADGNQAKEFKLLLTADNDLSSLIN